MTRSTIAGRAGRIAFLALFKPWVRWVARSTIAGRNRSRTDPTECRFARQDVDQLLRAAWADFDQLAPGLPREPTVGSRQNVLLACLTMSMLQALTSQGIERAYAIELIGDLCWKVYTQWGQIPRLVTHLATRDPAKRIRMSVEMFLRYPFNRPGYRRADIPEPQGRAFDVLRCPVAEYFAARGGSDLAVATWCNLDFPLARMWGGELERHGTLASGAGRCDFRFRAIPAGQGVGNAREWCEVDA